MEIIFRVLKLKVSLFFFLFWLSQHLKQVSATSVNVEKFVNSSTLDL